MVDYSTAGAILSRGTLQGYSDSSTWTRGQAWAIYGYAMVYRYTSDARMLAAAPAYLAAGTRCCDRRTRPPGVRSVAPAVTAQTIDSSGETRSQLTCRRPISIAPCR